MNLITMASKSPKAGERLRSKINLSRMSYYENLSFDEIKQSSIMFQALYMDRTYRPENIQHIYKKTGIKLSKEVQNKAKIASKAEKILEDFCQDQKFMMSKKDLDDSESLRSKLKKYLFFIHDFGGEFYNILGNDGRSRINRRVIECAPYVLRDDEFVRLLNNFKTFDPYYIINKLYIQCKKHNDVEKAIAVYDFGEQLMEKYAAKNTLIFNRPGQDVIKQSISKLIYFDGTNVDIDKNVDMFLSVLKSHESVFFKMLNYLFERNDANFSHDIWEYSKGMVRMFQHAIDHKKISFLEASNYAYKKINPIADASGKWTIYNRFVGYLKDTHEEQQNVQVNENNDYLKRRKIMLSRRQLRKLIIEATIELSDVEKKAAKSKLDVEGGAAGKDMIVKSMRDADPDDSDLSDEEYIEKLTQTNPEIKIHPKGDVIDTSGLSKQEKIAEMKIRKIIRNKIKNYLK
jgi:uncharacterized protein (UPF0147 family)